MELKRVQQVHIAWLFSFVWECCIDMLPPIDEERAITAFLWWKLSQIFQQVNYSITPSLFHSLPSTHPQCTLVKILYNMLVYSTSKYTSNRKCIKKVCLMHHKQYLYDKYSHMECTSIHVLHTILCHSFKTSFTHTSIYKTLKVVTGHVSKWHYLVRFSITRTQ